MYVLVHHAIHQPQSFWSQAEKTIATIPPHLKLHQTIPARDGTRATCLWEAASPQEVREFLEPILGPLSTNEYAPAENRDGIALPSDPAAADAVGIVCALYDVFNDRDFGRLDRLVARDAELVQVPTGITAMGPAGMQDLMLGWVRAFPDGRVEILNLVSSGERVAAEVVGRGTHTGPLTTPAGEIPATGRSVQLPVSEFQEVRNGKLVRFREYFDAGMLLAQIGASPRAAPGLSEPLPPAR